GLRNQFRIGDGLVGECAFEKERILVTEVPGDYIHIGSGLGEAPPFNIVVLPVLFESQVKAVVELASFNRFKDIHLTLLDQLIETIGIVLNTMEANMRTEGLLRQSQSLAQELQSQQEELRQTNARLERQAADLQASEDLLKKQQEDFAKTIYSSGSDLLTLINDILDMTKIESGTMPVDVGEMGFTDLQEYVERTFQPVAQNKDLPFTVELADGLPSAMQTDAKR